MATINTADAAEVAAEPDAGMYNIPARDAYTRTIAPAQAELEQAQAGVHDTDAERVEDAAFDLDYADDVAKVAVKYDVDIAVDDGWYATDDAIEVHFPLADDSLEAAEEYVSGGDWGEVKKTSWITVYVWQRAVISRGDVVEEARLDKNDFKIEIDPEEPACPSDEGEHDWRSPVELVGGIDENPGVYSHGGGVVSYEACMRCGCGRTTDTWAQDRTDGQQGLESVAYTESEYDIEAYLSRQVAQGEYWTDEVCIDGDESWAVDLIDGPWGWWGVRSTDAGPEGWLGCDGTDSSYDWYRTEAEARHEAALIVENYHRMVMKRGDLWADEKEVR